MKSEESMKAYGADLKTLYLFLKERKKNWHRADPQDFSDLFIRFQEKGNKDNTIQRRRACYRKFYKYLLRINKIKDDPTLILDDIPLKSVQPNPKSLDKEQRENLIACLKFDTRINCMKSMAVILGMQHGLRLHEIAKIKWSDFDREKKRLTVLGKGRKLATIPMSQLLFNITPPNPAPEFVFQQCEGHWDKGTIARWIISVARDWAGFGPEIHFSTHTLRHCFCTAIAEMNVPIQYAIRLTRHSSVETYIKNYVKLEETEIDKFHSEVFK
jgi:site-specific recombinase XerD